MEQERSSSNADSIRSALVAGVQRQWGEAGFDWRAKQARLAVDEVINTLRDNPAWVRGIGIGDER